MIVAILIEVIGQLSYRLGTPHCEADLLIYWMLMLLNILLNVNGILNSILLLPLVLNALTRHHDGCRGCPHKLGRHGPGAWIWWRVSCFLKLARRMPGIIWYYQVDSTMEVGLLIFWGKSCRINRFDRWNKFGGNIWNLHLRHENWHKLWYIQVIMAIYHIQYTKFTQNDIPSQRGNPPRPGEVLQATLSGAFRDTGAVLRLVLLGAGINALLTPLAVVLLKGGTAGGAVLQWASTTEKIGEFYIRAEELWLISVGWFRWLITDIRSYY